MSKRNRNYTLPIIIGILLLLGIGYCTYNSTYIKKGPSSPPKVEKTDTIVMLRYRIDTFYIDSSKFIIPKTVILYKDRFKVDSFIQYDVVKDTMYLTKHDTVQAEYNVGFLQNYPKSPKILSGFFQHNKLSLDLYYPDNQVRAKEYTVDVNNYKYFWVRDSLYAEKLPPKLMVKDPFKLQTSSSLYLTVNPINGRPKLAIDGTITYRRVSLYGMGSLTTTSTPLDLQIGTKVNLK